MFRQNTVIVLGAGASEEAKLPLGILLKRQVSSYCHLTQNFGRIEGNKDFYRELRRNSEYRTDMTKALEACKKIERGINFVSSVDNFLEVHKDDLDVQICAKAAICGIIANAERGSKLYVDDSNIYNTLDTRQLDDTWYLEVAQILFEKARPEHLNPAFEAVKFVSFNYDRCLEWFVYNAVQGLYAMDRTQAAKAMAKCVVYHPYGSIGLPEWIPSNESERYGTEFADRLLAVSGRIKTFTEDVVETPDIEGTRRAISEAETIVFLGFSFHPQNLDILRPLHGVPSRVVRILGTCYGMSDQDTAFMKSRLKRHFSFDQKRQANRAPDVDLFPLKCAPFMQQFKRTLSQ